MISRSDWKVAESIRQRVIAEGGYMFNERKEDGSWRHGFERYVNGELLHTFSPSLMADIRRNKVALHALGESMCREPETPPRGVGTSGGRRSPSRHGKVPPSQTATRKRGRKFHRTRKKTTER